ncbi:MAG: hypothetical protein JST86_05845 [Bacteroidetes bacterium]|nr:hypothetical protein [Bacteroidota bacterium]
MQGEEWLPSKAKGMDMSAGVPTKAKKLIQKQKMLLLNWHPGLRISRIIISLSLTFVVSTSKSQIKVLIDTQVVKSFKIPVKVIWFKLLDNGGKTLDSIGYSTLFANRVYCRAGNDQLFIIADFAGIVLPNAGRRFIYEVRERKFYEISDTILKTDEYQKEIIGMSLFSLLPKDSFFQKVRKTHDILPNCHPTGGVPLPMISFNCNDIGTTDVSSLASRLCW